MWFVMLRVYNERSPKRCCKAALLPHVIYILLVTYSRTKVLKNMVSGDITMGNSIKAYVNERLLCRSLPKSVYPRP